MLSEEEIAMIQSRSVDGNQELIWPRRRSRYGVDGESARSCQLLLLGSSIKLKVANLTGSKPGPAFLQSAGW